METLPHNLTKWTTEELIGEVVNRTAADAPALQLLQTIVLRARLAERDRRFGNEARPDFGRAFEPAGVGGTMEMSLADLGE